MVTIGNLSQIIIWDVNKNFSSCTTRIASCLDLSLIAWLPMILYAASFPVFVYQLINAKFASFSWTKIFSAKIFGCVLLLFLSIINLIQIFNIKHQSIIEFKYSETYQEILNIILNGSLLVSIFMTKKMGVCSSGVIFSTFIVMIFCEGLRMHTTLASGDTKYQFDDYATKIIIGIQVSCCFLVLLVTLIDCWINSNARSASKNNSVPYSLDRSVSFLSRITFSYFLPLCIKLFRHQLTLDEIWDLTGENSSFVICKQWNIQWQKSKLKYFEAKRILANLTSRQDKNKFGLKTKSCGLGNVKQKVPCPSIAWIIFINNWRIIFASIILNVLADFISLLNPLLLYSLIEFIESTEKPKLEGYFISVSLMLHGVMTTLLTQSYIFFMFKVAIRAKSWLLNSLYSKTLLLSNNSRKQYTSGDIANLMCVDVLRFTWEIPYLTSLISLPLQIIVLIYILYNQIGLSIFAGLAVLCCTIPISTLLINLMRKQQLRLMKNKDARLNILSEVLNAIKLIKLGTWEETFIKRLSSKRNEEVFALRKFSIYDAIAKFEWDVISFLTTAVSLAVFVLSDPKNNILTPKLAFFSLALFDLLVQPLSELPSLVSSIIQLFVSNKRIGDFLLSDELNDKRIISTHAIAKSVIKCYASDDIMLEIKNGSFLWDYNKYSAQNSNCTLINDGIGDIASNRKLTLSNINLKIKSGSLIVVIGQTGQGKTSLLNAFLGELPCVEGIVNVRGSISYVPQQAWIQHMSIRENILFSKKFDESYYKAVIDACDLTAYIDSLPHGDATKIGERGVNLSGGQKQRLSLARAAYQNLDVYLLDDPLSAVDTIVAKRIFDKLIGPKGLLNKSSRIFVTHSFAHLNNIESIVFVDQGHIEKIKSYQGFLSGNTMISNLTSNLLNTQVGQTKTDNKYIKNETFKIANQNIQNIDNVEYISVEPNTALPLALKHVSNKASQDIIVPEKIEIGNVRIKIYSSYLRAIGPIACALIPIAYSIATTLNICANVWLANFSNDAVKIISKFNIPYNSSTNAFSTECLPSNYNNYVSLADDQHLYSNITIITPILHRRLWVYFSIGIGHNLFLLMSGITLLMSSINASVKFHTDLLTAIICAPMSFFEETPIGRIINRFSGDIETMDCELPEKFRESIQVIINIMSVTVQITFVFPMFAIVMVPLTIIYLVFQRVYIAASRQITRLQLISASPIFSHLQETLYGFSSIRAYNAQQRFINKCMLNVDNNNKVMYLSVIANRFMGVYLQIFGNIITFAVACFVVSTRGSISAELAGLALANAIRFTSLLDYASRVMTNFENKIISIERILEYTNISSENSAIISDLWMDITWPTHGSIKIEKLSIRYQSDYIIKNVSCQIMPNEKVGIVGRTGSGKSTLIMSLFRLTDPIGGSIYIDNIDIRNISLRKLRSSMTLIPQEPILFNNTLRFNLDPLELHLDESVFLALEQVHLKEHVSNLSGKLNYVVTEGGGNFSVGQRQLIFLARALLHKTKILALDEATSAVDHVTDCLIQKIIRKECIDCTVLTIAHRLNTIMDNSRVMVLQEGRIREFDSPSALICDKNSLFNEMLAHGML